MEFIKRNQADIGLTIMVFIWGFHYIVLKDGLNELDPLAFNSIRYMAGLPVMLLIGVLNPELLRLTRRELLIIIALGLTGSTLFQVLFVSGLDHTTSTNSSILNATMPAWTAVISILIGEVIISRRLVTGLGLALFGVVLVVAGKSGAELSFSHDDMIGSLLTLTAAFVLALHNILKKPMIDRLGSMKIAIWTYFTNVVGLTVIAIPELRALSGDDLPVSALPNVLYSGILSGVGGFTLMNYGIQKIGPTRAASYFNFPPIVAVLAGILILGEPFTFPIVIGAALTLLGVMTVRHNLYLRTAAERAQHRQKWAAILRHPMSH